MRNFIGTIKNDMKCIGVFYYINPKTKKKVQQLLVKCLKCGREKGLTKTNFMSSDTTFHSRCGMHLGVRSTPFYSSWANMRTRTTNPNVPKYKDYGGRGINSDEFKFIVDFYDMMYESYLDHCKIYGSKNTTLERKDVNGNYTKDNCCWATWEEQARNKRSNLHFKAFDSNGKIFEGVDLKFFCANNGLNYDTVISGLYSYNASWKNGWCFKLCND